MAEPSREGNLVGGEFIAPNASPEARKFILAARGMMYSAGDGEMLKQAIIGAQSLSFSAVPFIAMVIQTVEQKLGELSPNDLLVVAMHLAGTVVDIAAEQGDPEAQNKQDAVEDIADGVAGVLDGSIQMGQGQAPMGGEVADPMAQAPMPPQGPEMPPILGGGRGV